MPGGREPRPRPTPNDWDSLRRRCLRETRRVLRHPPDAEDAAQEALLRIWRRDGSEPRSAEWLRTVSRNEALRLMQRRDRQPVPIDPRAEREADTGGWEEQLAARFLVDQLLRPLAEKDQQLLRMRYMDDLTQPEIARRLGIPEGTVKVRLHRLRKQLRETTEGDHR